MSGAAGLAVSFLAGYVALSYEILWYRVFAFASGGAAPTFALLLGAYLLGLAAGAKLSAGLCRRLPGETARQQAFLADYLVLANVLGYLLIPGLIRLITLAPSWRLWLCLVCPVTALLGAVYPLVNHLTVPPDARVGRWVSYLYLANILGSASGSLLTGFFLLDHWSLATLATFTGLVGLGVAALPLASLPAGRGRWGRAAVAAACGVVMVACSARLFHHVYERLRAQQNYDPRNAFVEVVETRAGAVAVSAQGVVYGGGIYDGSFNVGLHPDKNFVIRAYAGLSLHPDPRDVLFVGLSTGSWAQIVAHHPALHSLTAVEINAAYLRLYPAHPSSRSLLANPRVHVEIDDGRRWLTRHSESRFDMIFVHVWNWPANATNLLSREALEITRSRLKPGGVLYYSTTGSARVQRTGALAFPHALRVVNWLAVSDRPFAYRREALQRLLEGYVIDGVPVIPVREAHEWLPAALDWLERQLEGRDAILARTAGLEIVTDDNMGTEWTDYPLRAP